MERKITKIEGNATYGESGNKVAGIRLTGFCGGTQRIGQFITEDEENKQQKCKNNQINAELFPKIYPGIKLSHLTSKKCQIYLI